MLEALLCSAEMYPCLPFTKLFFFSQMQHVFSNSYCLAEAEALRSLTDREQKTLLQLVLALVLG